MLRKLATVLFVLAMAFPAMAQVNSRVSGTVTDSSGASVPGAKVELRLAGGANALYTAITSTDGLFTIPAVRPDAYDILVEAAGFQKAAQRGFVVQANRDVEIPVIRLEVGNVSETVEVSATAATVQTTNAEIAATITNTQLSKLPALNRSPLALLTTQAGVGSNGRTNTTINGMRVSFANVTIEGVNVQDNFIRSNGLDFLPNLLLLDQVGEVTLTTSNANPSLGNGAAQVAFTVPSGNNSFRGRLLWTNRNNEFAANTWFNNRDRIAKPFLNQNQVGGSAGGAIIKDKLFYYGNYELFRLRQQSAANRTVLTADARQGIYTYRATDGTIRKINVLQARGETISPTIQSQILANLPPASVINNFRAGDSLETFLRNTGGYSFNVRNNRTRDNVAAKLDYVLNEKNSIAFTYLWNRDIVDRPDLANDFSTTPKVANDGAVNFYSAAWRWSPLANLTTEFRGGANITPAVFLSSEEGLQRPIIAPAIGSNPVNTFFPQGRYTDTYNYQSNSTWVKGRHTVQFGFQGQNIRVEAFNDAGIQPTYTLGMSAANQATLTAAQLPGIAAADLGGANALLATLAGFYSSRAQTFNVIDRAAGFTPNSTSLRNLTQDLYSFYFQDTWKVSRRLTLNLGVRYDYFTVPDESNGLAAMPRLINGNEIVSLLDRNNFLDFASKKDGRPWFNPDRNNFAPNFGFAYQLGESGKTVLRGGYSLSYVNDELIRSIDNNVISTNAAFSQGRNEPNLVGRVSGSLPNLTPPTFTMPWAFSGSRALSLANAFGMPAQDLEVPYVQQVNLGIQHEVKGWIAEVRFVGNRSTNLFRAFDFNQIDIFDNGFLADFLKARNNGNLCRAAGRGFNPNCTGITGTQPLTVFPLLASGGLLTNGTILNLIDQGQPAELGSVYYTNGLQGNVQFFRNPNALATNMMTNYSYASYNALQLDFTRRFANGLQAQFNYVWSKNLSDSAGDGQARFEAFLDFNNAAIERSPTPFDQRHVFKSNWYYELPYGKGRRWGSAVPAAVDYILGGWAVSGILTYASGAPFSINSGRGTFNRGARSGDNGANIVGALGTDAVRLVMTGNGPTIIDPVAINPADGRGVNVDGQANFTNQVFENPGPGRIGTLQRRSFYGPNGGNVDASLQKNFRFTEKLNLEFRGEAFNIFNNPVFFAGDQNINSTQFGRLGGTVYNRRLMQFGIFLNWR